MNTIKKKFFIINEINKKLSLEFPNILLRIKNMFSSNIIIEIYYIPTKQSLYNNTNKFNIIDGGRKDRIIRKTKILFKLKNIIYKNNKNIFII